MAQLSDQTRLLYGDYAKQSTAWQAKCTALEQQARALVFGGGGAGGGGVAGANA
jgi:hypothetical protein